MRLRPAPRPARFTAVGQRRRARAATMAPRGRSATARVGAAPGPAPRPGPTPGFGTRPNSRQHSCHWDSLYYLILRYSKVGVKTACNSSRKQVVMVIPITAPRTCSWHRTPNQQLASDHRQPIGVPVSAVQGSGCTRTRRSNHGVLPRLPTF